MLALLGVSLDQPFRQQYETEHLRPFGSNVSEDLGMGSAGYHHGQTRGYKFMTTRHH